MNPLLVKKRREFYDEIVLTEHHPLVECGVWYATTHVRRGNEIITLHKGERAQVGDIYEVPKTLTEIQLFRRHISSNLN